MTWLVLLAVLWPFGQFPQFEKLPQGPEFDCNASYWTEDVNTDRDRPRCPGFA